LIIDNIVLVQEVIHSSFEAKEKGMVIKLDMANAFKWVRNSFLFNVLDKFCFSISFVFWIASCVISPWIGAPLSNGWVASFFQ
jgi:hypothetical protein